MKSLANILVIALIATGLIIGIFQLTLFINMAFAYPLGCGLCILVSLGAFEIIERGK